MAIPLACLPNTDTCKRLEYDWAILIIYPSRALELYSDCLIVILQKRTNRTKK